VDIENIKEMYLLSNDLGGKWDVSERKKVKYWERGNSPPFLCSVLPTEIGGSHEGLEIGGE